MQLLIMESALCRYAFASSADPAHAPNLQLGKDTQPIIFGTLAPHPTLPLGTWIPTRPINAEYDCLQGLVLGCNAIKDRRTCLSSRDGRNQTAADGIRILGEPCTWCGGIPCTTRNSHLCEPLDFVLNGQGKQFVDFTARGVYTVAKCKDGNPDLLADASQCWRWLMQADTSHVETRRCTPCHTSATSGALAPTFAKTKLQ